MNIRKIKAAVFFNNLVFVLPFLTPYFMDNNLNSFEIMTMQSIYMMAIFLFEVPSGVFSDHFGRKKTLILAHIFYFLAWLILLISSSLLLFIAYQVLFALGTSFTSGTFESYVYESVKEMNKESVYKETLGSINSYRFKAMAISSILGGLIFHKFGYYGVIGLTIITSIASLTLYLFIKPTEDEINLGKKQSQIEILKNGFTALIKTKQVKYVAIDSILFAWVINTFSNFNLIMLKELLFPVSLNGIYIAALSILTSIILKNYSVIDKLFRNSQKQIQWINISMIILIMTLIFVKNGYIAGLIWIAIFVIRYIKNPIVSHLLNKGLSNESRATSLSFISLLKNLGGIIIAPAFGFLYDLDYGLISIVFIIVITISIGNLFIRRSAA